MFVFLKAQLSSLISTAVDFIVTIAAVELLKCSPLAGTCAGAIAGALTNFTIGRNWVFKAQGGKKSHQMALYMLVWTGSFALNAAGMYLLNNVWHINYLAAKITTAILIGVCYNYVLQRKLVFPSA